MEKEQIIKLLSCFKFAMSFLSDEEKEAVKKFSNITLIDTPIFFSNDSIEYKVNNESLWQEALDNPDVIRTPDDKAEWDMEKGEKQIVKDFVLSIKADIEQIDCGCESCVNDFISGVNPVIEKYGLELKINGERSNCSLGLDLIDIAHNPVPEKTNEIIFPVKIEDLTDEIWHKAQMESLKKRGFEFFEGGLYVLDKDGKRTATITKEGYKSIND